ncbi:hypothetical protein DL991_20015 [Amycolatopsis sp. WAC 01375]|uniref:hypothetical protein n=1 Tax=Amycolatopsis sp. WAC 01375 TaxID=2203194 RepID=UPI000F7A188B|nr:hypothetical protein [Amycolatopsis sp. WAC 01375]RSM77415.1 hypothetical protein DL991_20015 [Amycolatopsis sp. WAC 01375]
MTDNDAATLASALDRHQVDATAMANALVELDRHPGHQLFTAKLSSGITAERWDAAEVVLAGLWRDFDTYRAVLADAEQIRGRRSKLGPPEVVELRRLLVEPSVEVSRRAVPLPERGLTGAAEQVESITLAALTTRMNDAYRQVSELAVRCDELNSATLKALAPLLEQARRLADDDAALAQGPASVVRRIREIEQLAGNDPLALADRSLDDTLARLTAELAEERARVDRLLALRDGWEQTRAELVGSTQALDDLRAATTDDYAAAAERVVGELPALPVDRAPELRAALARLDDLSWAMRDAGAVGVRRELASADAELRAARQLATGLLDRREELRGRFGAYQARAVRLGLAEEDAVMIVAERIKATLWRRPSDLAAATRDLGNFRRLLVEPGTDSGGSSA